MEEGEIPTTLNFIITCVLPHQVRNKHMHKNFVVLDLKNNITQKKTKKTWKKEFNGKIKIDEKKGSIFFWKFKISFRKKEFVAQVHKHRDFYDGTKQVNKREERNIFMKKAQ